MGGLGVLQGGGGECIYSFNKYLVNCCLLYEPKALLGTVNSVGQNSSCLAVANCPVGKTIYKPMSKEIQNVMYIV